MTSSFSQMNSAYENRAKLLAIFERMIGLPELYSLIQNYPNPFNDVTMIEYQIGDAGWIELEVFNLGGQKIRTLISEYHGSGIYKVLWDGRDDKGTNILQQVYTG
jgi:hypothetical protein